MRRLLRAQAVLTMQADPGGELKVFSPGAVGMKGDTIDYVGPDVTGEAADAYEEVVELRDCVLLPGLINAHTHTGLSLLRGHANDVPLAAWLQEHIWPLEAQMDAEMIRAGAGLAVAEMIRTGTSCCSDMYVEMEAIGEVLEESGLRAALCRGVVGQGGEEEFLDKFAGARRFTEQWQGAAQGRITTMLGPHAPYTCSPAQLQLFAEAAAELHVPLHMHLAETRAEVELHVERYGKRPVAHLQELGILDVPCIFAHVVHVNEEEIAQLAAHHACVVHNPRSNLKLGSGIAPVPAMLRAGIRPALGTDSAASNNNLDMLLELQLAALLHKGVEEDPEVIPAIQAIQMATDYGARALGLAKQVGTLAVGKQADVLAMRLQGVCHAPCGDPAVQLAYSASRQDVHSLYVAGKCLLAKGMLQTVDEEKIIATAKTALAKLLLA